MTNKTTTPSHFAQTTITAAVQAAERNADSPYRGTGTTGCGTISTIVGDVRCTVTPRFASRGVTTVFQLNGKRVARAELVRLIEDEATILFEAREQDRR